MAFPRRAELETAILEEVVRAGGRVRPMLVYEKVAARFNLSKDERAVYYPGDTHTPRWIKDQQWARLALVQKGDLDRNIKREWAITSKGLARIGRAGPHTLLPEPANADGAAPEKGVPTTAPTIGRLAEEQEATVRRAVLARLTELTPSEFERLVGRVLQALGFPVVTITGRSGDEGVDGECEMPLLNLKVAFQAKRYTSNTVGGPLMAEFRGRIIGRYDRGIYITTSKFTQGAEEMAEQPGAPGILLINGERLVEHMVTLGLGVRAEPLVLKQLDDDFFAALGR